MPMSWYEKDQPTPFDNEALQGLHYLDGDVVARYLAQNATPHAIFAQSWTEGMKFPLLAFPSGLKFEIWESTPSPIIHVFGEMDLALQSTRDEAYTHANDIAEQVGYLARPKGDTQLEVIGHDLGEHFIITYDNQQRRMIDIMRPPKKQREMAPPVPLLTDEIKAKLLPLYGGEKLGLQALAQVKFFTPDSHFTWYASEYNGEDIFFGLVSGFEVELGYFSLSELQSVRGGLGLPVERDLHFEPKTLAELKKYHDDHR